MSILIFKRPRWLPMRTSLFQLTAGVVVIGLSVAVAIIA